MILPVGFGSSTSGGGGYQIERSLRFNSADTAYLTRTPASSGNRKTWTWSGWVKRSKLGTNYTNLFGVSNSGSNAGFNVLTFGSNGVADTLGFQQWTSTYRTTTQVFRDVGGWLHIVCALDTTQATGADRVKLYVNGSQITVFSTSTDPTQNSDLVINNNVLHSLGRDIIQSVNFDGYMTEVYFIDGQALTPSSFGQTNTSTGVWEPKAYSGTYGTNGFYLKFADNSGTTSTTLGKDSSGNGNNWTPNNFSVTAGAGNDSLVDVPTSYGTDTGVGGEVRGNYCTWNSIGQYTLVNGTVTRSNGNLESTDGGSTYGLASFGTIAVTTGKWYWEVTLSSAGGTYASTGVVDLNSPLGSNIQTGILYAQNTGNKSSGYQVFSGSGTTAYGATYTAGDIIGVALNLDAGTITFYKNGVSQGVAYSGISGNYTPAVGDGQNSTSYTWTLNCGQRPFAYTAPSGHKALCTQNLPTPTIGATSTTQANDYFNAVLYTGNGGTQTVSGVGFQPDFVWAKGRSVAYSNRLYDVIRGATNSLVSNNTDGEATLTTQLTAFASDGFTLGSDVGLNQSSATYVAWNWKANGAGSSNTAGTITSTVSANTTSGFSIVTWTGNGVSNATVGHGLGVTPAMIILKDRDVNGSNANWFIWHQSLAANRNLFFTTGGVSDITALGGGGIGTSPTSSVFTLANGSSNNQNVNENTDRFVAYCFAAVAGYSAFGSYTGNGSADGPFVFTNHRPAFLLVKRTDTTSNWTIFDFQREGYNVDNDPLYPNLSDAEGTTDLTDLLSNGFKLRSIDASVNASGGTYIYMSLASNPFKYSLAR
jgi:hypothetical protein